MIRFLAGTFVAAMGQLRSATDHLTLLIVDGNGAVPFLEYRDVVEQPLKELLEELKRIPISSNIQRMTQRHEQRLCTDETLSVTQAELLLKEMQNNILDDLTSAWFLMIPAGRRALYEQSEPPFGEEVAGEFLEAKYDIEAAARCMALNEYTAAVFHLMRILEIGLRAFAAAVGLPSSSGVQFENWKNIIDQIEKKIRELEQTPKSPEKSETLRVYSQAATNFMYFKDAWRNHVSHARATYDDRESANIWNHVKPFMRDLSAIIVASKTP